MQPLSALLQCTCTACGKPVNVEDAIVRDTPYRTVLRYHRRCWYQQGSLTRRSTRAPRWLG